MHDGYSDFLKYLTSLNLTFNEIKLENINEKN